MTHTLHLFSAGSELHLGMPATADPGETLALCAEAMRSHRVLDFDGFVAPGAMVASTIVVNFAQITSVWVDNTR